MKPKTKRRTEPSYVSTSPSGLVSVDRRAWTPTRRQSAEAFDLAQRMRGIASACPGLVLHAHYDERGRWTVTIGREGKTWSQLCTERSYDDVCALLVAAHTVAYLARHETEERAKREAAR